jgi:ABC-type phosphate transport system substrate-binding protein
MENVLAAKYPISRYLYWYLAGQPQGDTAKLVDWVYSKEGQEIVEKVGYYPLTETDRLNFAARASGGTMKAAATSAKKKS